MEQKLRNGNDHCRTQWITVTAQGCKSKRPLVKASTNMKKKHWSKRPHFSKEIFRRNMGFLVSYKEKGLFK